MSSGEGYVQFEDEQYEDEQYLYEQYNDEQYYDGEYELAPSNDSESDDEQYEEDPQQAERAIQNLEMLNNKLRIIVEHPRPQHCVEDRFDVLYLIQQGDAPLKDAISAILSYIECDDTTVGLSAIEILTFCMKYGHHPVHDEVCSRDTLDRIKRLIVESRNDAIRRNFLRLIEIWAHTFAHTSKFELIQETMDSLIAEQFIFPNMNQEIFDALTKKDLSTRQCLRCRKYFKITKLIPFNHPMCKYCIMKLHKISPLPDFVVNWKPNVFYPPNVKIPQNVDTLSEEKQLEIALAVSLKTGRDECKPRHNLSPKKPQTETASGSSSTTLNSSKECCVCLENGATHLFVPCGHKCICQECSRQFSQSTCPVCRSSYTMIIPVYD